jgi:hypothetical protein
MKLPSDLLKKFSFNPVVTESVTFITYFPTRGVTKELHNIADLSGVVTYVTGVTAFYKHSSLERYKRDLTLPNECILVKVTMISF